MKMLENGPFACPRWATELDARCFVRLPSAAKGRPGHDLVDALRGHVFATAAQDCAGDSRRLTRAASLAWCLDLETVEKQLKSYRKGRRAPSLTKQSRLAAAFPPLVSLASWPWPLLYFRRISVAERTELKRCQEFDVLAAQPSAPDVDAQGFWLALGAFRRSLEQRSLPLVADCANALVRSAPSIVAHPYIRKRALEFVDLLCRLLHATPTVLFRSSLDLGPLLSHGLSKDVARAALLVESDRDWDSLRIELRFPAAVCAWGSSGLGGGSPKMSAWDFIPEVHCRHAYYAEPGYASWFD